MIKYPIIEKMKYLIVLFAPQDLWPYEQLFPQKDGREISAFERSLRWAKKLKSASLDLSLDCDKIEVFACKSNESAVKDFCGQECEVVSFEDWNTGLLLEKLSGAASGNGADFVVFAHGQSAFLDLPLTKKLIQDHTEFMAEYTVADGYPFGFAPEIIDSGALKIMSGLCKTVSGECALKPVARECIFDVIKGDINSFEIETEISSYDYRLLRLNFMCGNKINLFAAVNLSHILYNKKPELLEIDTKKIGEENVIAISDFARNSSAVLKSLPAYYNVQVKCEQGEFKAADFEKLCENISTYSGTSAVVSLSLSGEAVLHPEIDSLVSSVLSSGLTPLVEINAEYLQSFIDSNTFTALAENPLAVKKTIFIVKLDAATEASFALFHKGAGLETVVSAFKKMAVLFPETYPQFTRETRNEPELEAFYRYWSAKDSPSKGKIIIQKYDNFCGALPDLKVCDLSPVVREPCWHLRRDLDILFNGDVLLCRETLLQSDRHILGNIFSESIEELWDKKNPVLNEHIQKNYCPLCGKCDEYYTFNF